MSYALRPRAEADVGDIWNFTAERRSVDQANRYYRQVVEAFEGLSRQPTLGRPCDDVREGYRRYNVEAHVIFYLVIGADVEIVRVLHGRRDFRRHLPKA